MAAKVTLKQIAEQAGVSLTTVHRVLNNKEGCSEALKEKILAIAKEQGYTVNLAAASLRKQTTNIALLFPLRVKEAQYFRDRILDGYFQFRNEVSQFNVMFHEYYVPGTDMESFNDNTLSTLKNIYRDRPVHFDGVVVYGLVLDEASETIVNRIVGSGTRVIVVESCPKSLADICNVTENEALAGEMAGEMLSKFLHRPGKVVILSQDTPGGETNTAACMQALARMAPQHQVINRLLAWDIKQNSSIFAEILAMPDLVGIYSTCARHTQSMLRALERTGIRPDVVIGSELFEQSYRALHSGTMDMVIDKCPKLIGYKAAQMMFNDLIKGEKLPKDHKVTPRIILRANSDLYYESQEE